MALTLQEEALEAFRTDPVYVVDILEHFRLADYKRQLWAVRREVEQAHRTCTFEGDLEGLEHLPKDVAIQQLVVARGIKRPAAFSSGQSRRHR